MQPSLHQSNPLHEILFATNLGRHSDKETVRAAFSNALAESDPEKRAHAMGMLLNGIMAKGPTKDEVIGLLEAAFAIDDFHPAQRPKFASDKKTITIAGSGKKGFKTVNLSSLAAIVAACQGDLTILKLCSPSTSSVTGSQDFFSLIGGKQAASWDELAEQTVQSNMGFFPVESVLPRFASVYTGWYYAPHAMSFALAGLTCRYKTDYMYYGLAHPNVTLSAEVFRSFDYQHVMVAASTYDGVHYVDELLSQCGVSLQGYRGDTMINPQSAPLYVDNEVDILCTTPTHQVVSQAATQDENIIKGLSAYYSNKDLAVQVAINAAAYLVAAEVCTDFKTAFVKSMAIIDEHQPIAKLRELVELSGGDVATLESFLDKAEKYTGR